MSLETPSFSLDAMTLKVFGSMLQRLPREVQNEVRKSNRKHAAILRDLIRMEAPTTGRTASREGSRHDTRHGAIRRSITSRAGQAHAYVQGGGQRAPHFVAHEFGGGVFWQPGGGRAGQMRAKFGHKSAAEIAASMGIKVTGKGGTMATYQFTRAASGRGHVIPVKTRMATFGGGLGGKTQTESYFFFSTAARHIPRIQTDARDAAVSIIHRMLGRGGSSTRLAA